MYERSGGRERDRGYGRDRAHSPPRYNGRGADRGFSRSRSRSRSLDRGGYARREYRESGRERDRFRSGGPSNRKSRSRSRSREEHFARKRPHSPTDGRRERGNPLPSVVKTILAPTPKSTENDLPNSSRTSAGETATPATNSSPAPDSPVNEKELLALDELLDPEELLAKAKAEEAIVAAQAAERRRRLEEIKQKYELAPKARNSSAPTSATTNGGAGARFMMGEKSVGDEEDDDEDQEVAGNGNRTVPGGISGKEATPNLATLEVQKSLAHARIRPEDAPVPHAEPVEVLEAEDDFDANVELANDEGAQLAREKSALAAEEGVKNSDFAFDMFSDSPSHLQAPLLMIGKHAGREALLAGEGEGEHLQANWDDGEGYYKPTIGERIGDRFLVQGVLGKGVFSSVLKCRDLLDKESNGQKVVAVKMIRNNDTMRKAAEKERSILLDLAAHDPTNKRFCVRLLTYLEYRHHVGLVFEYQQMNLREALKRFGKDVGINISAVRIYGRQLVVALRYLMDLKIVHADIKLDNILCSEDLKTVKLCDFGSAFRETDTDNDPTPYLVSRFYRAPEIILGMNYDRAIDLWSVCVCLYELFTGHVMFAGRTNNEMLRLMMEVKGRLSNRMVRSHIRAYESMNLEPHFEQDCRFRQYETDSVTGKVVLRLVNITAPTRDLGAILRSSKAGADDIKLVQLLADLLDRGLNMDPTKRLTVVEALKHPFFVGKG